MAQLTFEELEQRILHELQQSEAFDDKASELARGIAFEVLNVHHPVPDAVRRLDDDLLKKGVTYAIPDDKLAFLPSLARAVWSVVAEGPFNAIPELVGILYRYRTLRIELNEDEAIVLRALKAAQRTNQGALTLAELRERIQNSGIELSVSLEEATKSLKSKETAETTLVREINGRWNIGNV